MLLVILDLNGTLCSTSFRTCEKTRARPYDGQARKKYYWLRPGLQAFLDALFQSGAQVAVWTSCPARNAEPLTRAVFGSYYEQLAFVFGREQCTLVQDGCYGSQKDLQRVWHMYPRHMYPQFHAANTVLVDDSVEKVVQHANYVPIDEYTMEVAHDDGLSDCLERIFAWEELQG